MSDELGERQRGLGAGGGAPWARTPTLSSIRSRGAYAGWGIADQLLYSISNAALTFVVAHHAAPREFGRFAILYTTIVIVIGLCRALTSEPYTVITGTDSPGEQMREVPRALGLATWLGAVSACLLAVAGLVMGDHLLTAFAIAIAPVVVQDCIRYLLVALRRVRAAVANDLVWTVAQFLFMVVLIVFSDPGAAEFALCWAAGAAFACLVGFAQLASIPKPLGAAGWWRRSRSFSSYYIVEFMVLAGSGYSIVYLVALTSGLAEAGAYRGAEALYGPVGALVGGLRMVALPVVVRRRTQGKAAVVRIAVTIGAILAGVTVAVATVLWAAGGAIGPLLLGATAAAALPLILPMGLGRAASSGAAGALLGMRSLGATRGSLQARIRVAVATVALATAGSIGWGSIGAAWGFAAASTLGVVLWYVMLVRSQPRLGTGEVADANER